MTALLRTVAMMCVAFSCCWTPGRAEGTARNSLRVAAIPVATVETNYEANWERGIKLAEVSIA